MKYLFNIYRREMKGCSTNSLLIMLRNSSLLSILLLLVRLARNMEVYSNVLRVSSLVWKRSMIVFRNCVCKICILWIWSNVDGCCEFQRKNSWSAEELAWKSNSSHCCDWWWEDIGTWWPWLPGIAMKFTCNGSVHSSYE